MKIYNYHPEYKYLIGVSIADESPLEPEKFLIPAHATDIEPPEYENGMIPIFNTFSWSVVKDARGTYYSTQTQQVIENYNPFEAPENATKKKPPEVPENYKLTWDDGCWVIELIPEPTPLTPEEKLQASGLTVEELKTLLGLN